MLYNSSIYYIVLYFIPSVAAVLLLLRRLLFSSSCEYAGRHLFAFCDEQNHQGPPQSHDLLIMYSIRYSQR